MPQMHAGFLYGIPALMAGQIVLAMAEQIPAQGLSTLFGSGGFLELVGEHLLDGVPALAWLAWMADALLLTVAWLVAARTVWRFARSR